MAQVGDLALKLGVAPTSFSLFEPIPESHNGAGIDAAAGWLCRRLEVIAPSADRFAVVLTVERDLAGVLLRDDGPIKARLRGSPFGHGDDDGSVWHGDATGSAKVAGLHDAGIDLEAKSSPGASPRPWRSLTRYRSRGWRDTYRFLRTRMGPDAWSWTTPTVIVPSVDPLHTDPFHVERTVPVHA